MSQWDDDDAKYGAVKVAYVRGDVAGLATERLAELHAAATKHNPVAPNPERVAEMRHRVSSIPPAVALDRLQIALEPQTVMPEYLAEVEDAWVAWDDEREPHAKALKQMRLAEYVAGLLEHGQALQKQVDGPLRSLKMVDEHPFTIDRKSQLRALSQVRAILDRAKDYPMTDQVEANRNALEKLTDVVEALVLAVEIHQ